MFLFFHLFKKGKVLIFFYDFLGKRPPQFYMPSYEAEIPESQRKDSDIISVKAKSFADREIR